MHLDRGGHSVSLSFVLFTATPPTMSRVPPPSGLGMSHIPDMQETANERVPFCVYGILKGKPRKKEHDGATLLAGCSRVDPVSSAASINVGLLKRS